MSLIFRKYTGWFVLALGFGFGCRRTAPEHTAYFDPVFRHADSLEAQGDPRSVAYVDSMFNAFGSMPGRLDQYQRYDFLAGHTGSGLNRYALSSHYIDSMLLVSKPFAHDQRYMDRYGSALLRKANVLITLGQNGKALDYYHEAKVLSDQFPHSCYFAGQVNEQLGLFTYTQRRYADAIMYFKAAHGNVTGCHASDPYSCFQLQQRLLNDLGLCYGRLGKSDSALYFFQRGLDLLSQGETQFKGNVQLDYIAEAKALIHGNMGTIYEQLGDYTREENAIKASLRPIAHQFDNGILDIADLDMRHLGRLDETRQLLQQARIQLDSQQHDVYDELEWRKLMWRYFDTTGHLAQAYPTYKSYVALHDSLEKARQDLRKIDVNREFEDLERKRELDLLQGNNQNQRFYLFIAFVFSVLSVSILVLIWLNWRHSRRNLRVIGLHNKHLELTLETLEQRNRDYDHLFKMVAHDLRNPIAGISGITNLLGESERINEEDRQMLALIQHSCSQLLRLIHELLESKSNPETRRLSMSWCDMGELLEECVSLLQVKAEEKRQQIKLSKLQAASLLADRNKMWRVLNNLLTNAIKFSPERSMIRVSALRRENNLLITVTDQGIGIPEDMRDKIFDAFGGARRSGTQGEQSFGLGLSICRQIVEAHGGSIWFDSEPGQGTSFYVTLPMPMIVEEAEAAV